MNTPRLSVVIPAYFSDADLPACLLSLRAQVFRDFETIVVNSSPETETADLVRRDFPEVVFIQHDSRLLPHAARNRGVKRARGNVLVFTDPDCTFDPAWIENLARAIDAGSEAVGGAMDLNETGWFSTGVHLTKFWWALPGLPPGSARILPTANAAYTRSLWERVGPFDARIFCGDATLSWHAARAGASLRFEPEARVFHHHEHGWLRAVRERFTRGREFAVHRAIWENWTAAQRFARILFWPVGVLVTLGRAGRASFRAGWFLRYVMTLPLQAVLQTAWVLGETAALLEGHLPER